MTLKSDIFEKVSSVGPSLFPHIESSKKKSKEILSEIHQKTNHYNGTKTALAITGSLARHEASSSSDLDAFIISSEDEPDQEQTDNLWNIAIDASGLKNPGSSNTFGNKCVSMNEILTNIGGNADDTKKLTQRMLLILESTGFGDTDFFEEIKKEIIFRYIQDTITNHQLGLFLLNDIIRYYRTICVDFEYKTFEKEKDWGIRNIKLIYSRKLIYFSGLIMCAELAQKSAARKREICLNLMGITPIERILSVLGNDANKALYIYDNFLGAICNEHTREELKHVKSGSRNESALFTDLKNEGHHFGWHLKSAFERHYDSSHPIHKAILF